MDNAANLISNIVNQYIVTPSSNLIGVDGFIFDIIDDEDVLVDSDITDHFVEDNYAIEDHIALKPVIFTLRGFVSELSFTTQKTSLVVQIANDIANVAAFLPSFSIQAQQAYNLISQINLSVENALNTASSLYGLYSSYSTTTGNQQNAFNYFKALRDSRTLCQVETPFGVFQNMAIMRIQATQKGDTKLISDFSVTFKEIKTVTSVTIQTPSTLVETSKMFSTGEINYFSAIENKFSGRAKQMVSEIVNNGQSSGESLNTINQVLSLDDITISPWKDLNL